MFEIVSVICFLAVGTFQQTLCFNANIPHEFKTMPECMEYVKMTINKLDTEFKRRNVTMAFKCELVVPIEKQKLFFPKNKRKWDV